MNDITDKRVEKLDEMTSSYIQSLGSLKEAFLINYDVLNSNKEKTINDFNLFAQTHKPMGDSIPIDISEIKKVKKLIQAKAFASDALKIVPESLFVSMVSQYDYLIGNIVRYIYDVNPKLICEQDGSITYVDLFKAPDLDSVKDNLLNKRIESLLRESHEEQLKILSSLVKANTLSKFEDYPTFVEMTQRRNILVHAKGIVSDQYVSNCKKAGCIVVDNKGTQLTVTKDYYIKAYILFCSVGVMLSQTIARIILKKENILDQLDASLNHVIYGAIYDEEYGIAIKLSEYATQKVVKHVSQLDTVYFILNKAQAYKWNGDDEKCRKIISDYDFSAMTEEILVAKYALEDNVDAVVKAMEQIGKDGKIMTELSFADWAIFKEMRKKKKFKDTFSKIFGKSLAEDSLSDKEKEVLQLAQVIN